MSDATAESKGFCVLEPSLMLPVQKIPHSKVGQKACHYSLLQAASHCLPDFSPRRLSFVHLDIVVLTQ